MGIIERAERLVGIGIGGLLSAFGLKYGLDVVLGILAVLSIVTVGQRVAAVYRQDAAVLAAAPAPDAPAPDAPAPDAPAPDAPAQKVDSA